MTQNVSLITCATAFLGKAGARALHQRGDQVFASDPSFGDEAARKEFEAQVPGVATVVATTAEGIAAEVLQRAGRVDVLVNNDAYPALRAPVTEIDRPRFLATLDRLAVEPALLTGALAPQMIARRAGKILFITSAAPLRGLSNYAMYVAARAAGNGLMLSLSRELAPYNIQVNALAPNFVESPTYFPQALLDDPAKRAKIEANIPLGRLGKPEEAAAAILYLTSDQAGFVTGSVLPFAGGWA